MKKLFPFLFCTLLFNIYSLAQTEVSGGIFATTTWTLSESPYIVTSDVVVFPDANLNIEPGVEIRFYSDTRLELRAGDLHAVGTSQNPITFTLDSNDPFNAQKWIGIENTSVEGEQIEVELEHVVIEHAQTGMHYGYGVSEKTITNAVFRYNDRGTYDGGLGYHWISIYDSEFLENGIGMEGRMSVFNSSFSNNGTGFGNPLTFGDIDSGGRVVNCTFTENDVAIGSLGQIITIAVIENSSFTNNGKGFDGYWANIDDSSFIGCTVKGVAVQKGTIQNSDFSENAVGLEVAMFNNELVIQDNNFIGNTIGLEIDGAGASITENTICDNLDKGAVLTTDQPVDLNFNCWCTSDLNLIADAIEDAYDNVSLGIVSFDQINIDCIEGLVFPGDGNNDGFVNNTDVLSIGLTYGLSEIMRPDASVSWDGQSCPDWSLTLANQVNAKHADCNGDGSINEEDLAVIELNYGKTHNSVTSYEPLVDVSNTYDLSFEVLGSFSPGETIQVDVILGESTNVVDNIYGIAFAVESNASFLVPNSFDLNTLGSWLGADNSLLQFSKEIETDRIELALVKNDQLSVNGYGKIASFDFTLPLDYNSNELVLNIEDITAITNDGMNLQVEGETFITSIVTDVNEINDLANERILVYPNPVSDMLFIENKDLDIEEFILSNSTGEILKYLDENTNKFSTKNLQKGVYFLMVKTKEGREAIRFVVQ